MSSNPKLSVEELKRALNLEPLPLEGGFFLQTYLSAENLPKSSLPNRYGEDKSFSSAILFLLTPESFSAFHKLPTDEVFHYYLGDAAELHELHQDGSASKVILGPDILNGHKVQHVVAREVWQALRVRPGGEWTLLGTTMAPAYTQNDFQLGDAAKLTTDFPNHKEIIKQLTRASK